MLIIFCFKQKTAYELRISDWSSDVCSSDLEESGVPKNSTYSDHVGIPTIGVGFNMRNSSNLIEVVREVLGDITWEPSDSPENTALMNDLASILVRTSVV